MNQREIDKLTKHFETYFKQSDYIVIHPLVKIKPHIDILLYKPNDEYPYWKLVTMGASDFRMPSQKDTLGNRNEYMMFVDPSEDLTNKEVIDNYCLYLWEVAFYPITTKSFISYGHSVEWTPEDGEEMVSAFLELPQIIPNPKVVFCKLGLRKTAVCLQVVLLTKKETEILLDIGPEQFSKFLYPQEQGEKHFLCELKRSDKF